MMEYDSVFKKEEILPFLTPQITLKDTAQSEISQTHVRRWTLPLTTHNLK